MEVISTRVTHPSQLDSHTAIQDAHYSRGRIQELVRKVELRLPLQLCIMGDRHRPDTGLISIRRGISVLLVSTFLSLPLAYPSFVLKRNGRREHAAGQRKCLQPKEGPLFWGAHFACWKTHTYHATSTTWETRSLTRCVTRARCISTLDDLR